MPGTRLPGGSRSAGAAAPLPRLDRGAPAQRSARPPPRHVGVDLDDVGIRAGGMCERDHSEYPVAHGDDRGGLGTVTVRKQRLCTVVALSIEAAERVRSTPSHDRKPKRELLQFRTGAHT